MFCFSPGGGAIKNIIPYMWDNKLQGPVPVVWVTYVHSVVNGKLDKMLQFHLRASDGGDYDNNWTDDGSKLGYWDIDSGGWPYNTDNEGELSRPAEPGVTYQPPRGDSSKYEIGWPLNIDTNDEIKTDADLPFLTIKSGTQSNGNFVETIFDKDRTQAIQFVYRKDDRKDLIQQTIGHMENGKWVQTTTRSEDLFKWILNRLEPPWAEDQGYYGYDPETFEGHWGFRSMEIHWNIDTNPDFTQWWVVDFWLRLKKGRTIDGIDQYSLDSIRCQNVWWHCRNDDIPKDTPAPPLAKKKGENNYQAPPGLPWDWLTEYDLKTVVDSWNEIVKPLPDQH